MDEVLEAVDVVADSGLEGAVTWLLRLLGLVVLITGVGLWLFTEMAALAPVYPDPRRTRPARRAQRALGAGRVRLSTLFGRSMANGAEGRAAFLRGVSTALRAASDL
jgi:hypothetical protein